MGTQTDTGVQTEQQQVQKSGNGAAELKLVFFNSGESRV